jgi:hypothetical protein
MPKPRGKEWEYVKVLKEGSNNYLVECNYCSKQFWIGSGSRIRAHLGVETLSGSAKCEKVPEQVTTQLRKAESKKTSNTDSQDACRKHMGSASEVTRSDPKQPKLHTVVGKQIKTEVDKAVARMCYITGISFNVVNNKHFKEMCSKIAQHGPTYQLPSDYPVRTSLLQTEYNNISQRVDQFHNSYLAQTGGTIVSDGWSDVQHRPILNILLVTPAGATFLNSVDSSEQVKTAQFIADVITTAIEEVGPQHVVQVITDSAANCKASWETIKAKFPHIICSPCAAHCLDLLLEDWSKLPMASVIKEIADVVTFINGHEGSRALLRKHSPEKGLLRPGETRFGTNLIITQRFVELKDALQELIVSRQYKAWIQNKPYKTTSDSVTKVLLSNDFWNKCQLYMEINKPVYELLRLIDGNSPVTGKIYYRLFQIQEKINLHSDISASLKSQLYETFIARWAMLHTTLHAAGFLLDPEYLGMAQNSNEEVMTGFYQLVEQMFTDTHIQVLIANQLSQFRSGHGIFGREVAKAAASSMSAYQWWQSFGACVPELQQLAVRVLSQTASSSEAERNWSLFAFMQGKKRYRLNPSTMEKLVYIHANTRLLDKITDVDYVEDLVAWGDAETESPTGSEPESNDGESA